MSTLYNNFSSLDLDPITVGKEFEKAQLTPQHVQLKVDEYAIRQFRFSQATIAPAISTGTKLEDLTQTIKQDGWDFNHPLHIVAMPDQEFTSFDNRRLYALKEIVEKNPNKHLEINVVLDFHPDQIDSELNGQVFSRVSMMGNQDQQKIQAELQTLLVERRVLPNSYGYSIATRTHALEKSKRQFLQLTDEKIKENSYGYCGKPVIWNNRVQQQFSYQTRSQLA